MALSRSPGPAEAPVDPTGAPLLSVENLSVTFQTRRGVVQAVDRINYTLDPGEVLAIVGESGCGKSVSALALVRLLPQGNTRITGDRVLFDGVDLLELSDEEIRARRGRDIGMIFQEPMTSLNPTMTIGAQIMEPLQVHLRMPARKARARAMELLQRVGMTDPERRVDQYPHELSGGMRQRVMISIAIACEPKLLIADEPTTALDVTIQAQILELLKDLSRRLGIAVIFITHNLGVVARYADRVAVMYAGRQIEGGPVHELFSRPCHPYTVGLLRAVPRLDQPRREKLDTIEGMPPDLLALPSGCRFAPRCSWRTERCVEDPPRLAMAGAHYADCWRAEEVGAARPAAVKGAGHDRAIPVDEPLVRLEELSKHYRIGRATLKAVDGVSLEVIRGETLGLVGESGCGKTTIGRMLTWLETPTTGRITFAADQIGESRGEKRRKARRQVQAVFQDPYSSLNPRMRVGQILAEPLRVYRLASDAAAVEARVQELLGAVGLPDYIAERFPHELSGGQRQRVGIARALTTEPRFIVCDEPVSALDVSIQGQVISLLKRLQDQRDLTYLFIAHDLSVVRHIADRVGVMYLGRLMELAPADTLFGAPLHPYTKALIDAVPIPDPTVEARTFRRPLVGEIPSPLKPPSGCVFHTRCPLATEECRREVPHFREHRPGHFAACLKVT